MIVFGIHNLKGGVGKSTLSSIFASLLSHFGKTCLIDGDPQGTITGYLLNNPETFKYELADLLLNEDLTCEEVLVPIGKLMKLEKKDLWLLPSKRAMTEKETSKLGNIVNGTLFKTNPFVFVELMELLRDDENFDFVVIDLHPAMSDLERSILFGVDELMLPLSLEYFDLFSARSMEFELKSINRGLKQLKREVKFNKILINRVNKSFGRHMASYQEIVTSGYDFITVPQDSAIGNAQFQRQLLDVYDPESKTIPCFYALIQRLFAEYKITPNQAVIDFLNSNTEFYKEYEASVSLRSQEYQESEVAE